VRLREALAPLTSTKKPLFIGSQTSVQGVVMMCTVLRKVDWIRSGALFIRFRKHKKGICKVFVSRLSPYINMAAIFNSSFSAPWIDREHLCNFIGQDQYVRVTGKLVEVSFESKETKLMLEMPDGTHITVIGAPRYGRPVEVIVQRSEYRVFHAKHPAVCVSICLPALNHSYKVDRFQN
jgi:hypothetical protein